MKKVKTFVLLLIAGLLASSIQANANDNEWTAIFQDPPAAARPHIWWHWMNGSISRDGITADLEAMARDGIGGVQLFNLECGIPAGPVTFLTPSWHAMLGHAFHESRILGEDPWLRRWIPTSTAC